MTMFRSTTTPTPTHRPGAARRASSGVFRTFVLAMAALFAFAAAVPAFAQVDWPKDGAGPECAASVNIFEAKQTSVNIRVGFAWTTVGATSATATIQLFPLGSTVPIYNSGNIAVSPVASGSMLFLIAPAVSYNTGIYKVRVRLNTNCGASSQYEAFLKYTKVLQTIVRCDSAVSQNRAVAGQQCLSFVPNGLGGFTLNHSALTDGDPMGDGLQHAFIGLMCETYRNGSQIEQYEVEHTQGTLQGNIVEYGATNGAFYQTGTTPQGNYYNLPTTVPADGATYQRSCFHWAGNNLIETTVTATLP